MTPREMKGFAFEKLVYRKLRDFSSDTDWKPFRAKGVDFQIGGIELEAKFSHSIIFPCWIRRDWITRFSERARAKLVVVNRGIKFPIRSLELLKENNITVVFFDRLIPVLKAILSSLSYRGVVTNFLNVLTVSNNSDIKKNEKLKSETEKREDFPEEDKRRKLETTEEKMMRRGDPQERESEGILLCQVKHSSKAPSQSS